MRGALVAAILTVSTHSGHAGQAGDAWSGSFGLAAGYFDYRERDGGRQLNREQGGLPGFAAAVRGQSSRAALGAELSYFGGDVRYGGETSTGRALTTRTDQRIADASVWAGPRDFDLPHGTIGAYAGTGLRWWHRDIRSTRTAVGVAESYVWPYLLAGVRAERRVAAGQDLSLDARLIHPVAPELRVDFKNDYDSLELRPAARLGGRLGLAWSRPWSERTGVTLTLWYEQWRFDASDPEPLRRSGAIVGSAREPASRTEFIGLSLSLRGGFL